MKKLFLAIVFMIFAIAENNELIKFETQKVIVFKDGYCLVIKKGSAITDDKGRIVSHDVPESAVLGSLWATAENASITSLNAHFQEITTTEKKEVLCTSHIEILEANKGKKCKITTNSNQTYEGTILQVLVSKSAESISQSQHEFRNLLTPRSTATISSIAGSHFVLRTQEEDIMLAVSQIRSLSIHQMKTTLLREVEQKERRKQLTFRFAKTNEKHDITLMYFTPGMRWIPSYRISLQQDKKAMVSLQAEIVNDNEDLVDVPMDIVVGVPNFRFKSTVSPLSLETTLRNVLRTSAPNRDFVNSIMSQQINSYSAPARRSENNVELPSELTAKGSQDLFVYKLPKQSIVKGGRAAVHIFTTKVQYRDIYTWKARVKHNLGYQNFTNNMPIELSENKIWHEIELLNDTELPWTTGAAMLMQESQPLAQELMRYTSSGSKVRIPVTVAVDVQGTIDEKETDRALRNTKWDGYYYAKINNHTQLDVCNNKREAVEVEITFQFGGKAVKTSDNGKITLKPYDGQDWNNYRGLQAVNNSCIVVWKAKIEPGKSFLPKVDYFYYVRH